MIEGRRVEGPVSCGCGISSPKDIQGRMCLPKVVYAPSLVSLGGGGVVRGSDEGGSKGDRVEGGIGNGRGS